MKSIPARRHQEVLIRIAEFFVPRSILECLDEDVEINGLDQVLRQHGYPKDATQKLIEDFSFDFPEEEKEYYTVTNKGVGAQIVDKLEEKEKDSMSKEEKLLKVCEDIILEGGVNITSHRNNLISIVGEYKGMEKPDQYKLAKILHRERVVKAICDEIKDLQRKETNLHFGPEATSKITEIIKNRIDQVASREYESGYNTAMEDLRKSHDKI